MTSGDDYVSIVRGGRLPEAEMDTSELNPLPYQVEVRDYLKSRERELWNWFASARAKSDYTESLRLSLLKATYRLDADGHPDLYQAVAETKLRLGLDIPVTVYQAQESPQSNASLYFIPGEGHVVFSGPALTLLNSEELKSVLGHELAHYHLWSRDDGGFHITDRLLQAVAQDACRGKSRTNGAPLSALHRNICRPRLAARHPRAESGHRQPGKNADRPRTGPAPRAI